MRPSQKARHTCVLVRRCSAAGRPSSGNVRRVARSASWAAWVCCTVCRTVPAVPGLLTPGLHSQWHDGGRTMAGAMRRMAVSLGLGEHDHRYDDPYPAEYGDGDDYADYVTEYTEHADPHDGQAVYGADAGQGRPGRPGWEGRTDTDRRSPAADHVQATDLARITTLHPRTYNEARTIGEHFREGTPGIMNLTEIVDSDAKRHGDC